MATTKVKFVEITDDSADGTGPVKGRALVEVKADTITAEEAAAGVGTSLVSVEVGLTRAQWNTLKTALRRNPHTVLDALPEAITKA